MSVKGIIKLYNSSKRQGIITLDQDKLELPFDMSYEQTFVKLFEPGDKIECLLEQKEGQFEVIAQSIRIYEHANLLYDIIWCRKCEKYRMFSQVIHRLVDGDWGDYFKISCGVCGETLELYANDPYGFSSAYRDYRDQLMVSAKRGEFEQAIASRNSDNLITFLKNWGYAEST